MKRFLKWLGIAIATIATVIGIAAAYVALAPYPTYDIPQVNLTVQSTEARVAHGRRLAMSLCVACHADPETKLLTGKQIVDLPQEFGTAYSRNITQHKTAGIGSWTDAELYILLRTGIHPKTGSFVPPWMPRFNLMADEDVFSIIAWLRSPDPMLTADPKPNTEGQPSFLAKFLARVAFKPMSLPSAPIVRPDSAFPVQLGKYLANGAYGCFACHSANFATMNNEHPERSEGFYGGGNPMPDANLKIVPTANITPDKATGIGSWTEEEFVRCMVTGIRPNGRAIRYPMAPHPHVTESEHKAIYAYLMSIPAITNAVTAAQEYPEITSKEAGKRLYHAFGCVRCHGISGLGVANLRRADAKYPSDSVLADVIRHPRAYNAESYMPVYASVMSEADARAVAAYVRTLCK